MMPVATANDALADLTHPSPIVPRRRKPRRRTARILLTFVACVLVLNALWFGRAHPTHFNVEEAVEAARAVGAARTYLTHLTHRVTHAELEARLPGGVFAAYDGLTVDIG